MPASVTDKEARPRDSTAMKRIVFLSGTGLVALHLIDAAVVDVEPGASLARHIPWLAATLAVAAAAALSYERLPRGGRAAVAGIFGAPYRDAPFDRALCHKGCG